MAFDWDLLARVGGVAGLVSAIVLIANRVSGYVNRPALNIEFDKSRDLQVYRIYHEENKFFVRKFFNLIIRNSGRYTAKRCVAIAEVLSSPPNVAHLRGEYAIHWADVPYSGRTTGAEPVDIGSEVRRLDVVFTDKEAPTGAWLSIPLALSMPKVASQAYFPPGDYQIKVKVSCENGKGDSRRFKVASPQNWTDLDAVPTG